MRKDGANCRMPQRKYKKWQLDTGQHFNRVGFGHARRLIFRNEPDSQIEGHPFHMPDFVNSGAAHFNQPGQIWRRACNSAIICAPDEPHSTGTHASNSASKAAYHNINARFA